MSELKTLLSQRDDLLDKIKEVEELSGWTESENNAVKVLDFNLNQILTLAEQDEATAKLANLFKKIYFEKLVLIEKLKELQAQIEARQSVTLLSSEFDYAAILVKYDVKAINGSVMKYCKAVRLWIDELIDKLDHYENKHINTVRDLSLLSLKLSFSSRFSDFIFENCLLDMDDIKNKLMAVKCQNDELEKKVLRTLENEEHEDFEFIAEITSDLVREAIRKIEYFEGNRGYLENIFLICNRWKIFKKCPIGGDGHIGNFIPYTSYHVSSKKYHELCEDITTYLQWEYGRYLDVFENDICIILEREQKRHIVSVNSSEQYIAEKLVIAFERYKRAVENFYFTDRVKYIKQTDQYQESAPPMLSEFYRKTAYPFHKSLKDIIFECAEVEDQIFIIRWMEDIITVHINHILDFIKENSISDKISVNILYELISLKHQNIDAYLNDLSSYDAEADRIAERVTYIVKKCCETIEEMNERI